MAAWALCDQYGNRYTVKSDEFTLGASRCDFILQDCLDPCAAVIERQRNVTDGNQYAIRDRHSRDGTFVNGSRVAPDTAIILEAGDQLRFGRSFVLLWHNDQSPRNDIYESGSGERMLFAEPSSHGSKHGTNYESTNYRSHRSNLDGEVGVSDIYQYAPVSSTRQSSRENPIRSVRRDRSPARHSDVPLLPSIHARTDGRSSAKLMERHDAIDLRTPRAGQSSRELLRTYDASDAVHTGTSRQPAVRPVWGSDVFVPRDISGDSIEMSRYNRTEPVADTRLGSEILARPPAIPRGASAIARPAPHADQLASERVGPAFVHTIPSPFQASAIKIDLPTMQPSGDFGGGDVMSLMAGHMDKLNGYKKASEDKTIQIDHLSSDLAAARTRIAILERDADITRTKLARVEESQTTLQHQRILLTTERDHAQAEAAALKASLSTANVKIEEFSLTVTVLQRSLREGDHASSATQAASISALQHATQAREEKQAALANMAALQQERLASESALEETIEQQRGEAAKMGSRISALEDGITQNVAKLEICALREADLTSALGALQSMQAQLIARVGSIVSNEAITTEADLIAAVDDCASSLAHAHALTASIRSLNDESQQFISRLAIDIESITVQLQAHPEKRMDPALHAFQDMAGTSLSSPSIAPTLTGPASGATAMAFKKAVLPYLTTLVEISRQRIKENSEALRALSSSTVLSEAASHSERHNAAASDLVDAVHLAALTTDAVNLAAQTRLLEAQRAMDVLNASLLQQLATTRSELADAIAQDAIKEEFIVQETGHLAVLRASIDALGKSPTASTPCCTNKDDAALIAAVNAVLFHGRQQLADSIQVTADEHAAHVVALAHLADGYRSDAAISASKHAGKMDELAAHHDEARKHHDAAVMVLEGLRAQLEAQHIQDTTIHEQLKERNADINHSLQASRESNDQLVQERVRLKEILGQAHADIEQLNIAARAAATWGQEQTDAIAGLNTIISGLEAAGRTAQEEAQGKLALLRDLEGQLSTVQASAAATMLCAQDELTTLHAAVTEMRSQRSEMQIMVAALKTRIAEGEDQKMLRELERTTSVLRRKIQELEGRLTDAKGEVSDALKEKVATLSTELEAATKTISTMTEAQALAARQAAYELATARAQTETKIRAIAILHERIAAMGDLGALTSIVEKEKDELHQQIVKLNLELEGRDKVIAQRDAQIKKEKSDSEVERKAAQNTIKEAKKFKEDLAVLVKENESNIADAQASREEVAALQLLLATLQEAQFKLTSSLLTGEIVSDAEPIEVTERMLAAVANLRKAVSDAAVHLKVTIAKFDSDREQMIQSMDGPMALMREKLANRELALDKYHEDLSGFEEAKSKAAYLETLQKTSGKESDRLSSKVKEQQRAITLLTHDLEDAKRLVEELRKRRSDAVSAGPPNSAAGSRSSSAINLVASVPGSAATVSAMPMAAVMQYGVSAITNARGVTATEELKQQMSETKQRLRPANITVSV